MEDPFDSSDVKPWKAVLAHYIDSKRPKITTWKEFCERFGHTPKTVKAIRDEFGIHDSVGPKAQPSPNFRGTSDHFLGEGI